MSFFDFFTQNAAPISMLFGGGLGYLFHSKSTAHVGQVVTTVSKMATDTIQAVHGNMMNALPDLIGDAVHTAMSFGLSKNDMAGVADFATQVNQAARDVAPIVGAFNPAAGAAIDAVGEAVLAAGGAINDQAPQSAAQAGT